MLKKTMKNGGKKIILFWVAMMVLAGALFRSGGAVPVIAAQECKVGLGVPWASSVNLKLLRDKGLCAIQAWGADMNLAEKATRLGVRYYPVVWGCKKSTIDTNNVNVKKTLDNYVAFAKKFPGSIWLMFNEPNLSTQANCSVADGVEVYEKITNMIKVADTTAKFGCCGEAHSKHVWTDQFLRDYQAKYGKAPMIDAWVMHLYDEDVAKQLDPEKTKNLYKGWESWKDSINPNLPVIISEMGPLFSGLNDGGSKEEQVANFIPGVIPWLYSQRNIERVMWFSTFMDTYNNNESVSNVCVDNWCNSLTLVGKAYFQSAPNNGVRPVFNYQWLGVGDSADTVAPIAPSRVACWYDPGANRVRFNWSWAGDKTCVGCGQPAGYCTSSGTTDYGKSCDVNNSPFEWKINNQSIRKSNIDYHEGDYYYNAGLSGSRKENGYSMACGGSRDKYSLEVVAVDAVGNKSQPVTAECECGGCKDTVAPNEPMVSCEYNPVKKKMLFKWEWTTDRNDNGSCGPDLKTVTGVSRGVNYCSEDGKTMAVASRACDYSKNPPFEWQAWKKNGAVWDDFTGVRVGGRMSPQSQWQMGVDVKHSVDCNEGEMFKVQVRARDAFGNISKGVIKECGCGVVAPTATSTLKLTATSTPRPTITPTPGAGAAAALEPPKTLVGSCSSSSGPVTITWTDAGNEDYYYLSRRVNGQWNYEYKKIFKNVVRVVDEDSGVDKYSNVYDYNIKSCRGGNECPELAYGNQIQVVCPTRPTPTLTSTLTPTIIPTPTLIPPTPTLVGPTVTPVVKIAGDADNDGKVELDDLKTWKTEYLGDPGLTADFNGDTEVDLLDLKEWKRGYLGGSRPTPTPIL